MAGFRIVSHNPQIPASKRTAPIKRKTYRDWIGTLPCIVTGTTPVEAAHISTANLSYGHLGRGKGAKASDRWCLPLSPEKHAEQHQMKEIKFWNQQGIDPYLAALTLYALWTDLGDDATDIAQQIIWGRKVGR